MKQDTSRKTMQVKPHGTQPPRENFLLNELNGNMVTKGIKDGGKTTAQPSEDVGFTVKPRQPISEN